MRVVKGVFLLLLIGTVGCVAMHNYQKTFQGIFYEQYTPINYGVSYKFNDHSFKITVTGDLGSKKISKGTYRIAVDTLILNYEPMHDPDPSFYKIIRRVPVPGRSLRNPDSTYTAGQVQFQVENNKGKPINAAVLHSLDSENKIIKGFSADKFGRYPLIEGFAPKVKQFRFAFIGYKKLFIPADTLRGYQSKVKVMLSNTPTSYSDYKGTRKFLIEKAEKDQLVLKRLNYTGKYSKLTLQRVNSE